MMENRNSIFRIAILGLGGLVLLPAIHAVVPPPDGGYPGGNTAEGASALASLTNGTFNTAVGFLSLKTTTDSSFNTAIGAGALLANTAFNNTATGAGALLSNTTGEENTANGAFALFSNTEGLFNTAVGALALQNNTTGFQNTAVGNAALVNNTEGALNTAIGDSVLFANTSGNENTANGDAALGNNTEGTFNTAIGVNALRANVSGDANTALGLSALSSNTSGNNNIALGADAGNQVTTARNVICIGTNVGGANVDNSCFIGNIRDALVAPDAAPVLVDSAGKLGTTSGSSRRFKNEIKPMNKTSETILALMPVTFHYKGDKTNAPQFGLIAEEVAQVNPDLVVRDKDGEIYTVRYDAVNAMLLNEFLKEHKKVQAHQAMITELKSTVAQQQKGMKALAAQLKEQATQLQKVSARLESSKPKTRVVLNNP
jgi:hypothetical protein